ncbi:polyprenyl synthetase family protein [Streptomyces sp. NPDC005209]|uniref:polyprenyl synthetase family protein n=1 Tax=Streptomyces sp. NPDC005209 TaxID=3156715 RepID=UPI0033BBB08A
MPTPVETVVPAPEQLVHSEVERILHTFLAERALGRDSEPALPEELWPVLATYALRGGKRLRSLLCVMGWHAAGRRNVPAYVIRAASSLELFHACALLIDDVMDDSELRRGVPTAHRALARNGASGGAGRFDERLGVNAAILLGNLAFTWSDELFRGAGMTPGQLRRGYTELDAMRTATVYGQYQDLLAAHQGSFRAEEALYIAHFKTARYTVEAPLRLGAALGDADDELLCGLSEFAVPLGIAFQLRDDLLGVFGDPAQTGKSHSDDLRDGKCTVLAALAVSLGNATQAARLLELLRAGTTDTEDQDEARRLMEATGARAAVEERIGVLKGEALTALDATRMPRGVADRLRDIAGSSLARVA